MKKLLMLMMLLVPIQLNAATGSYDDGTATAIVGVTAPSENQDGTALTDLDYVSLLWGGTSGNYVGSSNIIMPAGGTVEEVLIINWSPGVSSGPFNLYIVGTATDTTGNVSGYSNEVVYTFVLEDTMAPRPPVLNGVNIVVVDDEGRRWTPVATNTKISKRSTKRRDIITYKRLWQSKLEREKRRARREDRDDS